MQLLEQVLRLGRRGPQVRPFCTSAGVRNRGYSECLQRVLVDFGAEHSFAKAAEAIREHYGLEVPLEAIRQVYAGTRTQDESASFGGSQRS